MINLLSASTAVPKNAFKTTELVASVMHKLSAELINTISNLGVDQRYSTLDNYPDFLRGKPAHPTSSTTQLSVAATKRQSLDGGEQNAAHVVRGMIRLRACRQYTTLSQGVTQPRNVADPGGHQHQIAIAHELANGGSDLR